MDDVNEELSPQQAIERQELERAFRDVFSLAAGKRVLFWMLEQCAIYRDPDCGENTHGTSALIGEQRAGRKLIAKLDEIDPRFYPALLLEIAEIKEMDRVAARARAAKQEPEDDEDE